MKEIRVGMIGAGWVVQNRHLPALSRIEGVSCRLVWSRDPSKAHSVAQQFGIARVVENWEEICESAEIEAMIVAAPPILHCPATVRALEARKHVLCQGRMARNLREAREMESAARASDVVTALYPPRPGLKGDRVMRKLLADGDFLGQPREVRVTAMSLAERPSGYDWKKDPDVVGVNALTLGILAEVLNRWVGPAVRVSASIKAHVPERIDQQGKTVPAVVPESITAVSDLASGAKATYHLSASASFGPGHSIEIYGSRGALIYKLFSEEIQGATQGGGALEPIPVPSGEERLHTTDAEFIAAIRDGAPVSPTFADGVRYMEFCEAVALSALQGAAVDLPLPDPAMDSWGARL